MGGCCSSSARPTHPREDAFSVVVTSTASSGEGAALARPAGGRRPLPRVQKKESVMNNTVTVPPGHSRRDNPLDPREESSLPPKPLSGGETSPDNYQSSGEDTYAPEEPSVSLLMDAVDIVSLIQRADSATRKEWEVMIVPLEYRGKTNRKKMRDWLDDIGKLPRPVIVLIQDSAGSVALTASTLGQNHKMLVNMEQRLKPRSAASNASESTDSRRPSGQPRSQLPDYTFENEKPLNFIEELMEEERRYSDVQHSNRFRAQKSSSNSGDGLDRDSESDGAFENGSAVSS